MLGFAMLLGHLVGDFIVQNDWMAKHKKSAHPGEQPYPPPEASWSVSEYGEYDKKLTAWRDACRSYRVAGLACTLHCLTYTMAVWLAVRVVDTTLPWWFYAGVFAIHWPVDRYRLAARWMKVAGQKDFATGFLFPWSVIVVDNTFHLLTLFVLWGLTQ